MEKIKNQLGLTRIESNDNVDNYHINIKDDDTDQLNDNDRSKEQIAVDNRIFIHRAVIFSTIAILLMYLPLVVGYKCYVCAGVIVDLDDMYSSTMLKMALLSSVISCIPLLLYSLSNIYDGYLSMKQISYEQIEYNNDADDSAIDELDDSVIDELDDNVIDDLDDNLIDEPNDNFINESDNNVMDESNSSPVNEPDGNPDDHRDRTSIYQFDKYSFLHGPFTSTLAILVLLNIPDLYLLIMGLPYKQDDFIYASLQVRDTFFNLFFVTNAMLLAPNIFTRRIFFTSFLPFAISNAIYNFAIIGQYDELTKFAIAITAIGLFDILMNTKIWFFHMRKIYGFNKMFTSMSNDELKCSINTLLYLLYQYVGWLVYWTCSITDFMVVYTYIVVFISIVHIFILHRVSMSISMQFQTDRAVSNLVARVLPRHSAQEYLMTGKISPRVHRNVTIFFGDIEGFTVLSSKISPIQVVSLLNRLHFIIDCIAKKFPMLFKVEAIGDGYVIAGGLDENDTKNDIAMEVANFSLLVKELVKSVNSPMGGPIRIRIGLHSGNVVSGVMGDLTPRYCLFGDAMNIASRMESSGDADRIHISETTAKQLMESGMFNIEERGYIDVKGSKMKTFWLVGASDKNYFVNRLLHVIYGGAYSAQQQRTFAIRHTNTHKLAKRILVVYRSKNIQKMISYKLESSKHTFFSTDDCSISNILSMVREHDIDVVLFQTAPDSRVKDAELEGKLIEGGFQGIVILISSTQQEQNLSNWNIVMPFETVELNSVISMISSPREECKMQ